MDDDLPGAVVDRLTARVERLIHDDQFRPGLCEAARDALGADGVALTMDLSFGTRVPICALGDATRRLEELEDEAREGPGRTATRTGQIQVATIGARSFEQWPVLSDLAIRAGLAGTFWAVPLRSSLIVVGALTLHRREGWLTEEVDTVQLVADAIGAALLRDPSLLRPDPALSGTQHERAQIYQAAGVLVDRLHIAPDDAVGLLRAHAYAGSTTLVGIARAVIDGRLAPGPL